MGLGDQLARTKLLEAALAASRAGISIRAFARKHGMNYRTVYRDLQALVRAGIPLMETERGRYRLPDRGGQGTETQLTPEELLALHSLRRLAQPLRKTRMGRALDRVWAKVAARDGQTALLPPTASHAEIALRMHASIDYERVRRIIESIEAARHERRSLTVTYRALGTGAITTRRIEPGALHFDTELQSLYLIAWCHLREAVRVFAVHRLLAASLDDVRFTPRPETSSEVALAHAFRVWREETVIQARIALYGRAAREARERVWHPSQTIAEKEDGVELTFWVAGLAEVEEWVLRYGPDACVLAPPELRRRVAHALAAAAARYTRAEKPVRGQRSRAVSPRK
jgi:predicted DNA-binding transcriptional regulator YafY